MAVLGLIKEPVASSSELRKHYQTCLVRGEIFRIGPAPRGGNFGFMYLCRRVSVLAKAAWLH